MKKKIIFVTGTRADYGKMKPLIRAVDISESFEAFIYVCGMHLSAVHGSTYNEIIKDGYKNIHVASDTELHDDAAKNLGYTVIDFSGYIDNVMPDLVIVHGDRLDALAGAVAGAFRNIPVLHIEGGERSGTIDESIRHAVSKFAHIHCVCNEEAKRRLIQMGEQSGRIYVIGSPDVDIMLSESLPSLKQARERYDIEFENYAIFMYHPVHTELESLFANVSTAIEAVKKSGRNYIVIYPNNDRGSDIIIKEIEALRGYPNFKIFSSLRFEYFLTLLKNADFIIGNSSSGIMEAGIYGVPAIDIGSRQTGRYDTTNAGHIIHADENAWSILRAIEETHNHEVRSQIFGDGTSAVRFMKIIDNDAFWDIRLQKSFVDLAT